MTDFIGYTRPFLPPAVLAIYGCFSLHTVQLIALSGSLLMLSIIWVSIRESDSTSRTLDAQAYWEKKLLLLKSKLDGSVQVTARSPEPEVARTFDIQEFNAQRHATVRAAPDVPVLDNNVLHLDIHYQLTPEGLNALLGRLADKDYALFEEWDRFLDETLYQLIARAVQATVAAGPQDYVVNGYSRESALRKRHRKIVRAVEAATGVHVERITTLVLSESPQKAGTYQFTKKEKGSWVAYAV